MRLRITFADFDFRMTNLDSVNLCTKKEISMEMWKSEISMEMFLTGTEVEWIEIRHPEIEIRKRNPESHVSGDRL
jgi:hypothetical protein